MLGIGTEIVVVLLLLVANGVFAMSEISIVAARKVRLQQRAEDGDRRAAAALALANAPTRFLSTVQIGISLVGVLAGAYGGATIAEPLQIAFEQIPVVAPYARGLSLGLVVAVITYLSLIIGELVPKRIGLNHPETIASWVAMPMLLLARIGGPFVALLTGSTNLVLRLFGIKGHVDPHLTEDEIRAVISQGAESGALEEHEESLVQRVFRVGDQRVGAIMTPRLDIEWVDVDATGEVLREFLSGHTHGQFVVCHGSLDNVLGTVRAADLLSVAMKNSPIALRSLIKDPLFVPDSMGVFKLLEALKASHRHLAIVLDEFGAVEGLVTVTDLLEAFVGSLPTDAAADRPIVARGDGSWLVDGAAPIGDVSSEIGLDELPEGESGAYHTLGGFVMTRLGRIPRTADNFEWGGMRFEVMDMDGRRIDKVLVSRVTPSATEAGESRRPGADPRDVSR
jgi:putative hemolysin